MNDRLAFRAMIAVAGLLLFCLGCLLILPFRFVWLATSLWAICCSLLMASMTMPIPIPPWLTWVAATLAGSFISLMVGNGLWTAWKLGQVTRHLIQTSQLARVPHPLVVTRLADQLNLADSLVVVSGRTPFSFCYGLWQPRICLSLGLVELLTEAELEAVLQHEAYHLQRREPLRMAIAICLSRFFFFVPLLAELRERYLTEKELAADAAAVARTGQAALARALHKLITLQKPFVLPPLAAVSGLTVTAQRVDRLVTPSLRSAWVPSYRSTFFTVSVFILSCLVMIGLS